MGIKFLGSIYILYLGLTSLYSSGLLGNKPDNNSPVSIETTTNKTIENFGSSFYQGLISNIFNPKVALFYLSLMPQFVHNQNNLLSEVLFLTFLYSLVSAAWYSLLVLSVDKFHVFLSRNSIKRRIEAISGMFLVGLSSELTPTFTDV